MHSIFFFSFCALLCSARLVTFSNVSPRRDSNGAILTAHDGSTRRFTPNGLFYYHAMGYPNVTETGKVDGCLPAIYGRNNAVKVYSSSDLSSGSWKLEENIYPGAAGLPSCTYFRSQVVFNPHTQLYILWVNVAGCDPSPSCPAGKCGQYVTATAVAPQGPWKFHGFAGNSSFNGGDFALFVDDAVDNAGYAIVTHGVHGAGPRDMYIFNLTLDFLSFSSAAVLLPGPKLVEAPALFRRNNVYYALLGGCTCMGLYGGGVAVLTAPSMLGPWMNVTSTLDPGCPMMKQSTCFQMGPGNICNPVSQAQQNFVIQVPLVSGDVAFIWTGDRWQQSPDGNYDEQPQTWFPLTFNGDTILPLEWVDEFTLDIDA